MEKTSQTTTWDAWNPVNYGINYQPHLVLVGFLKHQHPIIAVPTGTSLAMPWQQNGQAWRRHQGFSPFLASRWLRGKSGPEEQVSGNFQWKKRIQTADSIRDLLIPDRWRSPLQSLSSGDLTIPKRSKELQTTTCWYLLLVACYPIIIGYSDPCWFWTLEIRGLKIWPTQTMHTGWVEIPQNYHTFMFVSVISQKKNYGEFKWSFTAFKLEIPCAPNEIWRLFTEKKIIDLYRSLVFFFTSNVIKSLRVNGTVRREVAGRKSIWFVNETVGF